MERDREQGRDGEAERDRMDGSKARPSIEACRPFQEVRRKENTVTIARLGCDICATVSELSL